VTLGAVNDYGLVAGEYLKVLADPTDANAVETVSIVSPYHLSDVSSYSVSMIAVAEEGSDIEVSSISSFTLQVADGVVGDDLLGDDTSETLTDGEDSSVIAGFAGNDELFGNGGDDILVGGLGDDDLTGGSGVDTFVLTEDGGTDNILDFNVGGELDVLDVSDVLAGAGISPVSDGSDLSDYVEFNYDDGSLNTTVSVIGVGDIAIINGDIDLATLLTNDQINFTS